MVAFRKRPSQELLKVTANHYLSDTEACLMARRLIQKGADPNVEPLGGSLWRPLHRAAQTGKDQTAAYLMQRDADAEAPDCHEWRPWDHALANRNIKVAEEIFSALKQKHFQTPETLFALVENSLQRAINWHGQKFLTEAAGECIFLSAMTGNTVEADKMLFALVAMLRDSEPEGLFNVMDAWANSESMKYARSYFSARMRLIFAREGLIFAPGLIESFNQRADMAKPLRIYSCTAIPEPGA